MTASVFGSGRKTYRVASPLKVLTPVMATLAFTLVLIAAVSKPQDRIVLPYMLVFFALVIAIVYWLMSRTRLEVSSDGITYYSIGYKVRSTWPNIEGYGKRLMGSQNVECLILRESGLEMSRWMQLGLILQPVGQVAGAIQGRTIHSVNMEDYAVWIPIGLYAENWRLSELGDTVKRYAPQAFDTTL